ncbi:hypothetical protein QUF50_10510 [Thiotrichales bacterium HSG1]|nr:hypothetical protein [Thiotrichales bacterium HSG1]
MISITDELHITYHLANFIGNKNSISGDVQIFINKVYNPILKILNNNLNGDWQTLVQGLFNPVFTTKTLVKKEKWQTTKYNKRLSKNQWLTLMKNPLHSQTVIKDTKRILTVFPVLDADNGKGKVNFHPVKNLDLKTSSGYEVINELAILIDFNIAMETLIGGDLLLPILDKILWQETELVVNTLKHNPILTNNFILYLLQKHLIEPSTVVGYAYAYGITDDLSPMNEVFDDSLKGKFAFKQDKWSLKIGEQEFTMPAPDTLQQGKLLYFPTLNELLELRKQIAQIKFDYEFFANKLTSEQKEFLVGVLQ